MPLYSERRRETQLREAEARGEPVWTNKFSGAARIKAWHALTDAIALVPAERYVEPRATIHSNIWNRLRTANGVMQLMGAPFVNPGDDLFKWVQQCRDDVFPDVIEAALGDGFRAHAELSTAHMVLACSFLEEGLRSLLQSERIAFRLVDRQMVPFDSLELHVEVVEPALTLLGGRAGFADAESAYRKALGQIAHGEPDNAVTDAGRALEDTLKALGCEGNSLGSRIGSARKNGLIAPHDTPLLTALSKAFDWASSDRSESGDAHTSPTDNVEDAWLAVHIIGALIVRFAGEPRGTGR
jgi:hypothetical protein